MAGFYAKAPLLDHLWQTRCSVYFSDLDAAHVKCPFFCFSSQQQYKSISCFRLLYSWHDFLTTAVLDLITSRSQELLHHYMCAIRMLRHFCHSQVVERMSRDWVGWNLCEAALMSHWRAWDLVADALGYMISDMSHRCIDTKSNLSRKM